MYICYSVSYALGQKGRSAQIVACGQQETCFPQHCHKLSVGTFEMSKRLLNTLLEKL